MGKKEKWVEKGKPSSRISSGLATSAKERKRGRGFSKERPTPTGLREKGLENL